MKRLKFDKDPDGSWYIDLPEWPGNRSALLMVAGADTLLDHISFGESSVTVSATEELFDEFCYNLKLTRMYKVPAMLGGGAWYMARTNDWARPIWLCDVTKFVYDGRFPKRLYIAYDEFTKISPTE